MNIAVKPRAGHSKSRANRVPEAEWKAGADLAVDADEQRRLVANLGGKDVLILRNHGLLAVGRSIPEAFRRIYYLEITCRLQLDVMATGRAWAPPPPEVCAHTARRWDEGAAAIGTGKDEATREWPALRRMLERKYPGWRGEAARR